MSSPLHTALLSARPYPVYRKFITDLLVDKGRTTGDNQSDKYIDIARLNEARMDRLDRKNRLTDEFSTFLGTLGNNYTILVLTEGWCGDAAQIVPVLQWIDAASPRINLVCALRDENLPLMDQYLTNGGRSIPKVFFIDPATEKVLADWGPRPLVAQTMVMSHKHKPEPKEDYESLQADLHKWYARDKTASTQDELLAILSWLESR